MVFVTSTIAYSLQRKRGAAVPVSGKSLFVSLFSAPVARRGKRPPQVLRKRLYSCASGVSDDNRPRWTGEHALDAESSLAAHFMRSLIERDGQTELSSRTRVDAALHELCDAGEISVENITGEAGLEASKAAAFIDEQLTQDTAAAVNELVQQHEAAANAAYAKMQQKLGRVEEEKQRFRSLLLEQNSMLASLGSFPALVSKSRRLRWLIVATIVTLVLLIYVAAMMLQQRDVHGSLVWLVLALCGMLAVSQRAGN
jgi:hypothetical protein